jgi:hypothetical protein
MQRVKVKGHTRKRPRKKATKRKRKPAGRKGGQGSLF